MAKEGEIKVERKGTNQCYDCIYKASIPGNCHIKCRFDFKKAEKKEPSGDEYGISQGWFRFPLNYDPTWMTSNCEGFSEEEDPLLIKEFTPQENLLSILGKRAYQ